MSGLVVMGGVQIGELGVFGREIVQGEDGVRRADRHAGAAIDTVVGFHIKLRRFGEAAFILLRMDAIHRAGLYTEFVFGAGVRNYVCHSTTELQFQCRTQIVEI